MKSLVIGAVLSAVVAFSASAQDLSGPGGPQFKRVKPPSAGATKRILVQIAPRENPAVPPVRDEPAAKAALTPPPVAGESAYDWYWRSVSAALSDSGPGSQTRALAALEDAPAGQSVRAPSLQVLQDIAQRHKAEILTSTIGTKVSPALVLAVIGVESGGRPGAVSPKGASGLMQLMPATAERFGVNDIADTGQNIKGGVDYLHFLLEEFGGDPVMALAAYNAGEGAVHRNEGVPPYAETRDYVPKVLAAWKVARALCLTPPELISDGCVFRNTGSS